MKIEHNCKAHSQEYRATLGKPYRFLDSGLSHVNLAGIRYWTCKECGRQAAEIPALGQLLSAMAKAVVMKPALLNGEEIRFLRKRVGKKAADFAALINRSPEHFSKLENDQLPLQEETDKLIRLVFGLLSNDADLINAIAANVEKWLLSIKEKKTEDLTFKKKPAGTWAPLIKKATA